MDKLQCSRCKEYKSLSHFTKRTDRKRGYSYDCKECRKLKRAEKKTNNKRAFFTDLIRNAKNGCKSRNIDEFEIDVDYLTRLYDKQKGICPISGIKMTLIAGKGAVYSNVSIDRIDNNKGYIKGNIQLVCRSANAMKLNMNQEELERFIESIIEHWS